MPITLNPGFLPLLAGLVVLASPRTARAPIMAGAALGALWLLLDRDFGAADTVRQMGLEVVLLKLDALNQVFGIALLLALIVIAAFASGRRNRFEDAAILVLAGGSISALFAGDFILFVAAASLSGLASAWVVFASQSGGGARAGVRLLVWCGLESLFLLVGVALHLSQHGGDVTMVRLDARSLSGGFIFAAMMVRVGAPFAHVWLKDVTAHASPAGAAALTAFSTMLGVYALARLFPSEAWLAPIGAAMIVLGAFFAAAADDLRAAGAYAQTAHTGVCVALVGVGSPLALAAMETHAFAAILAFMAFQMSLGAMLERRGSARASELAGAARAMPFSAALLLAAGLAAAGAPGFALYSTMAASLQAAAQWETRWLWLLFAGLSAAGFVSLVLRPTLVVYRGGAAGPLAEAPYGMLLGAAMATFFCLAIGLAPHWLFVLTPAELALEPFALDRLARQCALLGAAGVIYLLLAGARVVPAERALRLLDLDALYRGPIAGAGRWAGVVALRVFGAAQSGLEIAWTHAGAVAARWLRRLDRPYANGLSAGLQLAAIAAALALGLLASRL